MPTITYTPVVHKGAKRILVIFKKDENLIKKLRAKTDAKWSKTHAAWHIADTEANRIKCKLPLADIPKTHDVENIIIPPITEKIVSNIVLKAFIDNEKRERIAILFEKNNQIREIVKNIANIKWSSSNKCWHVPCQEKNYETVCNALKKVATIDTKVLSAYLQNRKKETQKQNGSTAKKDLLHGISAHNIALLTKTIEHLQLKAYSSSTIRTYKNEIAAYLQIIKNKNADTLNTEDVRRYIHYCINEEKLAENTIHSRLNALKFFYEQVLGQEKFFVTIPRPKKHLQLPKVLGEQELRKLFAAPTNLKHKAILFVAYSAGLRVSEVINLRLQDIDRERQQLFIYCSKGKKDRYVMLSPMVLDVLEQYYKLSLVKPTNYLFEGYEKGEPYNIRSAQKIFADAKLKAGIIKSVTFHSLRHSFATHLLEKGVDVIFIKELLGHFDIKTTERYLHVRRDVLINIASPLDGLYDK